MKVGIVGAGWAGMAAAVCAIQAGHTVSVYESSRSLGGRARSLAATLPDGAPVLLDNGQHILIGAYRETLRLMRLVGVSPEDALLRLPLTLLFADGRGLRFPRRAAPLDAVFGIVFARGWNMADKTCLLLLAARWRMAGFTCPAAMSVASLCGALTPRVMRELVEPLCVSALNTPADRASGQVFLRIMRDSVLGASGDSNLLLPRIDLSGLFPAAAASWLTQQGASIRLGERAHTVTPVGALWCIDGAPYDLVVLATSAPDAVHVLAAAMPSSVAPTAQQLGQWIAVAGALRHEAITTVYAWGRGATLAHPMLALRSGLGHGTSLPAQFVFDRGQLGGPAGLLAFVVSASLGSRETLQQQVLAQAKVQLGLGLQPVQTVVEKRATFACTPGLQRPAMHIAPGLLACGDYVDGPYPSTLEGAVRSGIAAIQSSGSVS